MNISEFLSITSMIVPDRLSIIDGDRRITFKDLDIRVNRLANKFHSMGVGKGDRVVVLQINCTEHIEIYLAAAKLGAVYIPLNFRATADELLYMITDAAPIVIFAGQRYLDLIQSIADQLDSVEHRVSLEQHEHDGSWCDYRALLEAGADDERLPETGGDDLTMIMFTAGTTGSPKGVMLSHDSFSSYVLNNVDPADPDSIERNILTVPMYHIAGVQAALAAIYGGRTLVIQGQFEPQQWMQLVEKERVDRALMVPTMLKMLIEHPDFDRYDLSSLNVITYGAAPMPKNVIEQAIKQFPDARFINAFGQTETAATITMLGPEDHVIEGSPDEVVAKRRRLASIGRPLDDVEVRIVDDEGAPVSVGTVGNIVARGARLMKGYWKLDDATSEAIRGGWLYTGDLGYSDEDGYIFLSGRAKDFIKRGGEMISPLEVEDVLHSHPKIDEAAIIGVPDPDWGEIVRAIVILKSDVSVTEREVIEFCRGKLASFKKPESVVFVNDLPKNPMGKILKRILRERYSCSALPCD